jgi:signal transduction histidine kinase
MNRAVETNIDVNSTLADLPAEATVVLATQRTEHVKDEFDRRPELPGVIVFDHDRLLGVVSRDMFFRRLSGPYARELFLRKPIKDFCEIWCTDVLRLDAGCTIHRAADAALSRPHELAYEPILVDYGDGELRLLDVYALLIAQSQLLSLSKVIVEQRDAAEAANRSKSEFLANISHELRTPLHGILSYSRFGVEDATEGDRGELREYFENVSRSAEMLLNLVNDLLDLSKLEAGRMVFELQRTTIEPLVEVVVDEFRSLTAEKRIHITYRRADEETPILADGERFKQVVRNLLSNAIKFSPSDGVIHVRTRRVGKNVLMSVRDQGPGIPPEELEMIFDKFAQSSKTKSGSGGTGLGLSICREIVTGHHGRIWAENNTDVGSIFFCELPLAPAKSDDDDADDAPPDRNLLEQFA